MTLHCATVPVTHFPGLGCSPDNPWRTITGVKALGRGASSPGRLGRDFRVLLRFNPTSCELISDRSHNNRGAIPSFSEETV
jgi:hypothetical protein